MGYPGLIAAADNDGMIYKMEDSPIFEYDLSPVSGGWTTQGSANGIWLVPTSNPPMVSSIHPTDAAYGFRPMPDVKPNMTDAPGTVMRVVEIDIWYRRKNAASVVTFSMYRARRDGAGAGAKVIDLDGTQFTVVTDTWTKYTSTTVVAMDPTYFYWFEFSVDPDASQFDACIGPVLVRASRDVVE